ncbi:MAG: CBS domain-containing protein [Fimbriimonadales bacterium]
MMLSEVMHVHVPTLSTDATFRDAVDKMDIYQFPALVIVNADRSPIAVITEGDLARAVSVKGDVTGLARARAIEFSSRDPQTADANTEVSDALHLMISNGLSLLPVVSTGRLMGVVLRVDLMQALQADVASPAAED